METEALKYASLVELQILKAVKPGHMHRWNWNIFYVSHLIIISVHEYLKTR